MKIYFFFIFHRVWLKSSMKKGQCSHCENTFFFCLCNWFLIYLFSHSIFYFWVWTLEPVYNAENLKHCRLIFSSSFSHQPCRECFRHHADVLLVYQLIHDVTKEILSSVDFKSQQHTISFHISLSCLGLFHFFWHRWPILDATTHFRIKSFHLLIFSTLPSSNWVAAHTPHGLHQIERSSHFSPLKFDRAMPYLWHRNPL